MRLSRKFLISAAVVIGSLCALRAISSPSSVPAGTYTANPSYKAMMGCFSRNFPDPSEVVRKANRGDYSFLNTPAECQHDVASYMNYCEKNSATPQNCSAEYAASWVALNEHREAPPTQDTAEDDQHNGDNDYAARNNPYERPMLECFATRIVLGGKWYDNDGLKSARQMTRTQACSDITKTYFYWCKNHGGDSKFCDDMTVKGAQMIIADTPYHGRMHESPEESQQMDAALAETRKAAETGDPEAQTQLGLLYFESNSVRPRSPEDAFPWFKKAAEQGNPVAQTKLGTFYQYGLVVKRNPSLAEKWWRKAAEQGNSEAATALGSLYENGSDGVPQNSSEAAKWYAKTAEQGDSRATQLAKQLGARLQKSPAYSSKIMFVDTKWGINENSDDDPACMQAFDHDPVRYERPSRHSLDWCLVNMIRGGTPWSDMDACSLPLGQWCQDMGLGAVNSQKCIAAKKAEYEELRAICKGD